MRKLRFSVSIIRPPPSSSLTQNMVFNNQIIKNRTKVSKTVLVADLVHLAVEVWFQRTILCYQIVYQ